MLNGRVDGTWSLNGMSRKLHTDAKYRREIDTRPKMKICDGSMGAYYSSSIEIFIVIVKGRGICICAAVYLHLHPLQLLLSRLSISISIAECKFQLPAAPRRKDHMLPRRESSMINNPALHPHLHVRRDYNTSLTLLCLVLVQRKKYDYEAMIVS